ncbi:proline-, glutamic acid- and leucine-rich protein 1 [Neolamprologus brichardi]|uniref:proline-, glutamic acid- and leucine-rich protein 1 n=1 Tax=Neolamprologus brichardi TaxID=32507 RepID=UPI001643C7F6|nr:proline-, glutamic acid- and leucine-rich protein 1 [Neolamprologus brichardi]
MATSAWLHGPSAMRLTEGLVSVLKEQRPEHLPALLAGYREHGVFQTQSACAVGGLVGFSNAKLGSSKTRFEGLCLLSMLVKDSSSDLFQQHCLSWLRSLQQVIQSQAPVETVQLAVNILKDLLQYSSQLAELAREVGLNSILGILTSLLGLKSEVRNGIKAQTHSVISYGAMQYQGPGMELAFPHLDQTDPLLLLQLQHRYTAVCLALKHTLRYNTCRRARTPFKFTLIAKAKIYQLALEMFSISTDELEELRAGLSADVVPGGKPGPRRTKHLVMADTVGPSLQRKGDHLANQDTCLAAVRALRQIIQSSGTLLKDDIHKVNSLVPGLPGQGPTAGDMILSPHTHHQPDPAGLGPPEGQRPVFVRFDKEEAEDVEISLASDSDDSVVIVPPGMLNMETQQDDAAANSQSMPSSAPGGAGVTLAGAESVTMVPTTAAAATIDGVSLPNDLAASSPLLTASTTSINSFPPSSASVVSLVPPLNSSTFTAPPVGLGESLPGRPQLQQMLMQPSTASQAGPMGLPLQMHLQNQLSQQGRHLHQQPAAPASEDSAVININSTDDEEEDDEDIDEDEELEEDEEEEGIDEEEPDVTEKQEEDTEKSSEKEAEQPETGAGGGQESDGEEGKGVKRKREEGHGKEEVGQSPEKKKMDDEAMASMLADFVACPPDDEDGASGSKAS